MAKALSDPKEIAAVPTSEPVLIELPADVTETAPAITAVPKKTEDPAERLTKQLEASEAANKLANDRAENAEKGRREAQALADQRANDLRDADTSRQRAEADLISGSLSGAQAELTSAKSEYAKASESGDFNAQADANANIARASQRVLHFEQMAAASALRKEREATRREVTPSDPIAAIDSNSNLIPKEKEWLKAHPEAIIDQRLNRKLGVAYDEATRAGLIRGTPEYFDHLETFMGYKKAAKSEVDDDQQTRISAAPVSRGDVSTSGQRQQTPSQITLTPDQREMARSMGISDVAYARQALALQQAKKSEPEKYYTPAGR